MAAAIIGADGSPYALGPRGRDACARSRSLRGHGIAVVRGGTGACGPVITTGCRPGLAWSAGATAILGLVGCSLFAVSGGSAVAGRVAGIVRCSARCGALAAARSSAHAVSMVGRSAGLADSIL